MLASNLRLAPEYIWRRCNCSASSIHQTALSCIHTPVSHVTLWDLDLVKNSWLVCVTERFVSATPMLLILCNEVSSPAGVCALQPQF